MALAEKYRCDFKDYYSNDVRVSIYQEGFSGSVTEVTPAKNPLTIEWPGTRGDIYHPVRGATATFNCYASENDQFNEFFDGASKEYRMDVRVDGSTYWRGWLMLEDYQESFNSPPYIVSIQAYDFGYLQRIKWNKSYHGDDDALSVLFKLVNETGILQNIRESVNIYEDSTTSGAGYSPFDQTNIHQNSFMDDSWDSISCYDALTKILRSFNAVLYQENGVYNIVRVPDLTASRNWREYEDASTLVDSGSEDMRSALSNYNELNRSVIMMAAPIYKDLNFSVDFGNKNLINNGLVGDLEATPLRS